MARKTDIKRDLINQLEQKGVYGSHYLDLINDYMALWDIKTGLIKDIKARGVIVEWDNGHGQRGTKNNGSIIELKRTNNQMLKILNELGLKGASIEPADDDSEM